MQNLLVLVKGFAAAAKAKKIEPVLQDAIRSRD
jgi:hypothetical protein